MTKIERISKSDLHVAACAQWHSGNHRLATDGDRRHAECQGCGGIYTAAEIHDAIDGRTSREAGQGGVRFLG